MRTRWLVYSAARPDDGPVYEMIAPRHPRYCAAGYTGVEADYRLPGYGRLCATGDGTLHGDFRVTGFGDSPTVFIRWVAKP